MQGEGDAADGVGDGQGDETQIPALIRRWNCNAMCVACNRRHNSDPEPYLRFMNERYGPETVAELDGMRAETRKVGYEELVETLARLKRML